MNADFNLRRGFVVSQKMLPSAHGIGLLATFELVRIIDSKHERRKKNVTTFQQMPTPFTSLSLFVRLQHTSH